MADYSNYLSKQPGFMDALAKLQESNQFQQNKDLQKLLQSQKLQSETDRQQAGFKQEQAMVPLQEQYKEQGITLEHDLKQKAAEARLKDVLGNLKNMPAGAGLSVGPEGASVTRQPNMGVYDLKKQQFDQTQQNKYAKGLEKYSDLTGAAQDLETITNRDGKGGVFTNPDAKLISGGKVVSAMPDAALGLAELTGMSPQGSAEERKALARYKLSMGHALTGARMNPTMQKAIQDSLGGMASGDPDLMAKGLRGSARIVGGTLHTVQGGFTPEVRGAVHEQMGSDPMEMFGKIATEKYPSTLAPDPGNVKPVNTPTAPAAPQQTTQAPMNPGGESEEQEYLRLKQKHGR